MMNFDPHITVGNLLEILMIGIGGLYFIWEIKGKLSILQLNSETFEKHLSTLEVDVKELSRITALVANQSNRMDNFDTRIKDLRENVNSITNIVREIEVQRPMYIDKIIRLEKQHAERQTYIDRFEKVEAIQKARIAMSDDMNERMIEAINAVNKFILTYTTTNTKKATKFRT